jgi:hypothetical protein
LKTKTEGGASYQNVVKQGVGVAILGQKAQPVSKVKPKKNKVRTKKSCVARD